MVFQSMNFSLIFLMFLHSLIIGQFKWIKRLFFLFTQKEIYMNYIYNIFTSKYAYFSPFLICFFQEKTEGIYDYEGEEYFGLPQLFQDQS